VKTMWWQVLEMNGHYICIVNYITQGNKYGNIQLSLEMSVKVVKPLVIQKEWGKDKYDTKIWNMPTENKQDEINSKTIIMFNQSFENININGVTWLMCKNMIL
jgi:hypothetical protein